jgi:hypothetical protein
MDAQKPVKGTNVHSKSKRELGDFIIDRVQYKINIYMKKAREHRFYHLFFSVLIAVCAALVPILINLEDEGAVFQYLATVLSAMVTISVAIQEIFRFREHWRNYNLIDSSLRSEEMIFSMGAGPYARLKNQEERQDLFVQRIENLIAEERKETINMRTRDDKDPPSKIE